MLLSEETAQESFDRTASLRLIKKEHSFEYLMDKSSVNNRTKILQEIQHIADELSEIERQELKNVKQDNYIEIFSFKSNITFLYKSNSEIKFHRKNDLECINGVFLICSVWGFILFTPYYLLASPVSNIWRFLVLLGQPLVTMVYSGHCVPELLILISSFLGFVYFRTKFEECNRQTLKFLKVSGFILIKKYAKFFILITIATGFTFYISPFLINNANYYTSGISYNT